MVSTRTTSKGNFHLDKGMQLLNIIYTRMSATCAVIEGVQFVLLLHCKPCFSWNYILLTSYQAFKMVAQWK